MTFRNNKVIIILMLFGFIFCDNQDDTSSAFMEAAQALFENKEAIGGLQGVARALLESETGKHVGDILMNQKSKPDGLSKIISGLGNLISTNSQNQIGEEGATDVSIIGDIIKGLSSMGGSGRKSKRSLDNTIEKESSELDFNSILNMASVFISQTGNVEGLMGLVPVMLDTFSGKNNKPDHSDHSWFMPPILENAHLMWDHFSKSEFGQTLWKNSGLANIVKSMYDAKGNIQWEMIMDSFENPSLRRRWISSLTNFVADWISHISDPMTQQRYLITAQFIGNSFLKSQGYPKTVMFEPSRPSESLSRLANAVAKRHLNLQIDSYLYIKPAVAYIQELMSLASEKGFIMSRINARELSNKLSDSINNGFISPLLKAYRAYKWGSKMPQCANQILCSINHKSTPTENKMMNDAFRVGLTKIASFPAAWGISNKSGLSFWSLYASILEENNCIEKYPADCILFHEEEIRVTTEYSHSEL